MYIKHLNFLRKKYIVLLLTAFPLGAFANFDFNANCLKAYQNIIELKLPAARQLVAAERKARPNNAISALLENYIDYFYLITNESKPEFERLEANKNNRLNEISKDDKNSPYYLYAQAEINLQWALMRSRFGEYYTASREINRASNLLQDNSKKFPGFHLNGKGIGLINVVMGSLPDGFMKKALAAFGIKGDVATGLNMLDRLAENLPKSTYEPFYEEVVFYYSYVLSDVVKSPAAYSKTMKYTARFADSSLLKTYLQAYVCARNGHNDEAMNILENRPKGSTYQPFPYLDYLLGIVKLNKLDFRAVGNFDAFLQNNKGSSYIKDTYLHLGFISLLKNDSSGYNNYIARVKNNGYTYNEKDKQALNEASAPTPNKELLKARLLFDGGYLNRALETLTSINASALASAKDKTEYYYRLGRVYDDLNKNDQALVQYQNAINTGRNLKYYYAAKAAVLAGNICEKDKNTVKAKSFYNTAIGMKNHEYENSIENEAKQGLKRLPD